MKRFIVVLLAIQLTLLAGCTFPFFGKPEAQSSGITDGQDMVTVQGSEQLNQTANGLSGNGGTDTNTGATTGTTAETTTGTVTTDTAVNASGTAIVSSVASSVASASTGTAVDSATIPSAQEAADTEPDSAVSASVSLSDTETALAEAKYPVTVYYQDGDGYLIPMTRWIQMQQGLARAAVSLGIDSAIAREEVAYYGVYPVIPVDTDILGIDIRDGIATIDFDRHLFNYNSAASERNIIACIVYTLTEFKTISKVRILVNGYPQDILKYGMDISEALDREDITINADASMLKDGSGKMDIFLYKQANEGFTYLVPVSVSDSEYAGELPEMLVKQLLTKETDGSLYTEMPNRAALLKCILYQGVLTLDFSEGFTDYGGNATEEGILKQLAYTVRQADGIKIMKILVEGQKAELPEGTDISAGIVIPATINDVMDR